MSEQVVPKSSVPASTATFGWARDGPITRSGGVLQLALLDLQDILRRALGDSALDLGRRQVEERNRALLAAIPDPIIRVRRDGTYLDVQADDHSLLFRPPDELIGRNIREFMPRDVLDKVFAGIEQALETGSVVTLEYELEIAGSRRWKETRIMPSGEDEVVSIVRDFTEQRRTEVEQCRLAEEQAALRRVATLVAGDPPPEEVFQTVTEEVCRLLGLRTAVLHRFEDERTSTIVGKFGEPTGIFELGNVIELEQGSALSVAQTGASCALQLRRAQRERARPSCARWAFARARVCRSASPGRRGARSSSRSARERRCRSRPSIGWRALRSWSRSLSPARRHATSWPRRGCGSSRRAMRSAAGSSATCTTELSSDSSRSRSVSGSPRRRSERPRTKRRSSWTSSRRSSSEALTDLRELAQGIHPAVLTDRGLGAAVEVLAARAPLRVTLDVQQPERLPDPIAATAYYVVSEALANVVKHAQAETAAVRIAHGERAGAGRGRRRR